MHTNIFTYTYIDYTHTLGKNKLSYTSKYKRPPSARANKIHNLIIK